MESQNSNICNNGSALIFLGTGCSSAVPNVRCLLQPSDPPCSVCSQALSVPPNQNPNYRCNTSLVIDHYSESDNAHSYILIDVGKTFREQVLRWFTLHNIPRIDSIILTHEHADAVLGLDDIRAVQPYSPINDIDPTPIYLSHHAMNSIAEKFPYLVQKQLKPGQEIRRVAQLDWHIIEEDHQRPFVASGIQFVPLPVMHGEDYISLGFLFGEKCRVAYISDVSRIPSSTEHVISKASAGQLDILILDTLYKEFMSYNHQSFYLLYRMGLIIHTFASLRFTLETVKRLCPKRALLIGMTHEFDHYKDNDFLTEWSQREGIPVQLARDGQRIPVELS
ncbi:hypothetical protein POTOM_039647 [Populus tomentosa]|uniref:Metallo-beta-lactamase domain-containing protein n=1 Tax=Populus tomentosa TaxID=118781 RepID=A0A8X7YV50_POPTO|nr:hypothetical protein POTOM_039647 [Populus tomentosa]